MHLISLLILVFVAFGHLECSESLNDSNGDLGYLGRHAAFVLQNKSNDLLENSQLNKRLSRPIKKSGLFDFFEVKNGRVVTTSTALTSNANGSKHLTKLNRLELNRILSILNMKKKLELGSAQKFSQNLLRIIFSYGR